MTIETKVDNDLSSLDFQSEMTGPSVPPDTDPSVPPVADESDELTKNGIPLSELSPILPTPNVDCVSSDNPKPTISDLTAAISFVPSPLPRNDKEYLERVLQSIYSASECDTAITLAAEWSKKTERQIKNRFADFLKSDESTTSYDVVFALAKINGFESDRDTSHVDRYIRQLLSRRREITAAIGSDLLVAQELHRQAMAEQKSTTAKKELRKRYKEERENADRPQYFEYKAEDGGIMDAFMDKHGELWQWAVGHDYWLKWEKTHWNRDKTLVVDNAILNLMDAMNISATAEAVRLQDMIDSGFDADILKPEIGNANHLRNATKRSATRLKSVREMLQVKRAIDSADLDKRNILNFPNGTLDMDTLEFTEEHNREHLSTYCLDYEYDTAAECPRWIQYLNEVLVVKPEPVRPSKAVNGEILEPPEWTPDTDLISLFQELLGYSLTTDNSREVMIWMYGEGGTGKSKVIDVLSSVLGPRLTKTINFHNLGQQGDYSIGDIPGKRVIFSTESDKGKRINEGYLKRIVSGETIDARMIYGSPFEFDSVSKVWWAMNDRPVITDTSDSIWRRMKLIPFYRKFSADERNENLKSELLAEVSGILNFAIEGLRRLRSNGKFTVSKSSENEIEEYRKDANPVSRFIEERTETTHNLETPSSEIYADYRQWCADNGHMPITSNKFGREVNKISPDIWSDKEGGTRKYNLRFLPKMDKVHPDHTETIRGAR